MTSIDLDGEEAAEVLRWLSTHRIAITSVFQEEWSEYSYDGIITDIAETEHYVQFRIGQQLGRIGHTAVCRLSSKHFQMVSSANPRYTWTFQYERQPELVQRFLHLASPNTHFYLTAWDVIHSGMLLEYNRVLKRWFFLDKGLLPLGIALQDAAIGEKFLVEIIVSSTSCTQLQR